MNYEEIKQQLLYRQLAQEDIARQRAEEAVEEYVLPIRTLRQELADDYEEPTWRIEGLHYMGNTTALVGSYKVGKTTMMVNLLKSLIDGEPFIGQRVQPVGGTVAYWNMEVEANQFRMKARDTGLLNQDKLLSLHLRGEPFPLWSEPFQEKVISWLRDGKVDALIIDPVGELLTDWPRVGNAGIENNNDLLKVVYRTIQKVKKAAGVQDLFIPMHTGHNAAGGPDMHARGGSVHMGTVDHIFQLWKKDIAGEEIRHFRSVGRAGDFPTTLLAFDPKTQLYSPEDNLEAVQRRGRCRAVVVALYKLGAQATTTKLREAVRGVKTTDFTEIRDECVARGYIFLSRDGRTELHVLNTEDPEVAEWIAFGGGMEEQ